MIEGLGNRSGPKFVTVPANAAIIVWRYFVWRYFVCQCSHAIKNLPAHE